MDSFDIFAVCRPKSINTVIILPVADISVFQTVFLGFYYLIDAFIDAAGNCAQRNKMC